MSLAETVNGLNGFGESLPSVFERRTIPFDYAFRYDLKGEPDFVHNRTVSVSIEGAFTAVSVGYGVVPKVQPIKFGIAPKAVAPPAPPAPPPVALLAVALPKPPIPSATLGSIIGALGEALGEDLKKGGGAIGPRTAAVLRDGFKFNPEFSERILLGGLAASFDRRILAETFQTVAAPTEQIQFLYALFDEGTGREFQSEPILNLAGLGASDGTRPFRYFALPIEFAPRSTIRMQVTELSAFQGELHVSLQGYKTLGTPGSPTGPRLPRGARRIRR